MSSPKRFRIARPFIALGVLAGVLSQAGHNVIETHRLSHSRAHINCGDRVEERYEAYSKRLAMHYTALVEALKKSDPDLLAHLRPSAPILHGYQILPSVTSAAPSEKHPHTGAVAYSWPWADRLIDNALQEIVRREAELRRAAQLAATERRVMLENLARNYGLQSQRQRTIHAHIQYNRLWQVAIANDRARYDRETALYRVVVERQKILNRLSRVHAKFKTFRASVDLPGLPGLSGILRDRAELLSRRIDEALQQIDIPAFIKFENFEKDWVVRVPLVTDIEDQKYVRAVKEIIENTWRLNDEKTGYRVMLDVAYVSSSELYSDKDKPRAGEKIDLRRHLERFPSGSAILTTGARTTHVRGHAIFLGPHPIAPGVLAHEFGHILGFRDRYLRGYKDLGEHGFQIIEVVADHEDIMGASAHGLVQHKHFLQLLERRRRQGSQV